VTERSCQAAEGTGKQNRHATEIRHGVSRNMARRDTRRWDIHRFFMRNADDDLEHDICSSLFENKTSVTYAYIQLSLLLINKLTYLFFTPLLAIFKTSSAILISSVTSGALNKSSIDLHCLNLRLSLSLGLFSLPCTSLQRHLGPSSVITWN
jgi:hypothetical protein